MKNPASSILACALFCAPLLQADFQPARWNYRRPLPADAAAHLLVFNLERGIYIHSQADLGDLRVVRGQDEVAYVLEKMSGSHQEVEVSSSVVNQGVTPSGNLELTVEVGAGRRHNGIRLATPRTNFRQRVGIATSDDGRRWSRARDDGSIFDFSENNRQVSVLYVSYPVSSRRFLQVTVYGWNDPDAVTRCWVTIEQNKAPVRDAIASLHSEPLQDTKTQSTVYTWDLGIPGIPHDELSLEVDTPAFERAAVVETSRNGTDWSVLGSGALSRFPKEQSLSLDFPENYERYLRLRIYNRDDRPLAVKSATLSVIRTRLKFKPVGGGSYWLYYGNAEAHVPSYDLRELLAREAPGPETTIAPGIEERNPAYREKPPSPKPWSERHPEILYITLALAVAGMGTVTVRFLRKAKAESQS